MMKFLNFVNSPLIMGVLNCTPDSFYDGGKYYQQQYAIEQAHKMVEEGAHIIDIGGESTRPFAQPVPIDEELKRVIPIVEALAKNFKNSPVLLSVDTRNTEVMRQALDKGADLINDVNALQSEGALQIVASYGARVCLMHMQGLPETMQVKPQYQNVVHEVKDFLIQRINACLNNGITKDKIIVDPGFGFGKTVEQNLQLLQNLNEFKALDCPILVGLSRKSMFGKLLGLAVEQRLPSSLAASVIAIMNGANIVRTHDVKATLEAASVTQAVISCKLKELEIEPMLV